MSQLSLDLLDLFQVLKDLLLLDKNVVFLAPLRRLGRLFDHGLDHRLFDLRLFLARHHALKLLSRASVVDLVLKAALGDLGRLLSSWEGRLI